MDTKVTNEPFITLAKIPNALANFTWNAKMHIFNKYALEVMKAGRRYYWEPNNPMPLPWELNELAAICVSGEDGKLEELPDPLFRIMINALRSVAPKHAFKGIDDAKRYLSYNVAMQQFPYQQDALIVFLRYKFLFSVVDEAHGLDMPRNFRMTFRVDYEDVAAVSVLTFLAAAENIFWGKYILDFRQKHNCRMSATFKSVVELFVIDRYDYAKRQAALIEFSSDGLSNAQNLLERYPFVKTGDGYSLPLPYLVNLATTRHLFDRMMEDNSGLRSLVGRWGMEPYVKYLFERSACYDSVNGSFSYRCDRNVVDSPDVWLQIGKTSIFVEVKLAEAPVELRQGFEMQVVATRKLAAKHVYQLFSRLAEICNGKARDIICPSWEDVFGVVVIHEDSYTVREEIYKQCFEEHPDLSDTEREWIRTRISVVALYSIEEFCYYHCSILPALQDRQNERAGTESILLNVDFLKGAKLDLPVSDVLVPIANEIPVRLFVPN